MHGAPAADLSRAAANTRIRLGDGKPAPETSPRSNEVIEVREYSVPARFSVGEHDNIAAMVFEHERRRPQLRHLSAPGRRRLDRRHLRRGGRADSLRGTGFDLPGGAGRRPGVHLFGHPLRVGDPRPGDPVRGRGHRADLRDFVGRAGALGAAGLGSGVGLRRDRRTRRDGHRTHRRTAGSAPSAAHRRCGSQGARPARRGGRLGRAGRADRPPRGAARRGPGDAHLHLGHHRTTQGLPTHSLQPAVRDPRRQGVPADAAE